MNETRITMHFFKKKEETKSKNISTGLYCTRLLSTTLVQPNTQPRFEAAAREGRM